jgi:hypothetical protein
MVEVWLETASTPDPGKQLQLIIFNSNKRLMATLLLLCVSGSTWQAFFSVVEPDLELQEP